MDYTTAIHAAALTRGRQVVRINGRVETIAAVDELPPGSPELPLTMHDTGTLPWIRVRTVAGNEWFTKPELLHEVLPLRYYGVIDGGLTHATQPGPEIFNGWAPAACNRNLQISVEHTMYTFTRDGVQHWENTPVLAVLGWPLFGEDDQAHVMIGNSPDCLRCRRAMGEDV